MRNDTVLQFKSRISGIFRCTLIRLTFLIPPLWEVCGSDTGDPFDRTEKVVDDVSPVAKHIEDNAATVFNTVVPRRTLRWDRIALENPVTELAANSDNFSKEVGIYQAFQFLDTR